MEKRTSGKMSGATRFIFLFIFLTIPASNASAFLLKIPVIHHRPQIFDIDYDTTHLADIDHMAGITGIDFGKRGIIDFDFGRHGKRGIIDFDFGRPGIGIGHGKRGITDLDFGRPGIVDFGFLEGSIEARPHHPGGSQRAPVPEPATMLLLGTGMLGIAAGIRRKRRG